MCGKLFTRLKVPIKEKIMRDLSTVEFIVYGISSFSRKKFKEVKNIKYFCKPSGGLWASPVKSRRSWREWCLDEKFDLSDLDSYCKFRLRKGSKIYEINFTTDLLKIPYKYDGRIYLFDEGKEFREQFIDFEKMKENGWDGIYLSFYGVHEVCSHYSIGGMNLYGWDVESLLLFNYDCIVPYKLPRVKVSKKSYKNQAIVLKTQKNTEVDGINKDMLCWKDSSHREPSVWVIPGKTFRSWKAFMKEARRLQKLVSDDPTHKFRITWKKNRRKGN